MSERGILAYVRAVPGSEVRMRAIFEAAEIDQMLEAGYIARAPLLGRPVGLVVITAAGRDHMRGLNA